MQANEKQAMRRLVPGTVIEATPDNQYGERLLEVIFSATSGLVLSQIREITGIESSALQNWIKRGWVSNPVNKKYNIDQVARILIINLLRGSLRLEKINFLMHCVNGRMDDSSDDIVPESKLYAYLCHILREMQEPLLLDRTKLRQAAQRTVEDYIEPVAGARERLIEALCIMVLAYLAAGLTADASQRLDTLGEIL